MRHHDPRPPQHSFMPPYQYSGNVGDLWPQNPMNNVNFDVPQPQFDHHAPPFKRPRTYDQNNPQNINYAPFPPPILMKRRLPQQQTNTGTTKGASNIFFKTRMCTKFLDGTCRNGENCSFAHGMEDMRQPPPNWQDIIREKDREAGVLNDYERIIHRNKICRKFSNGEECPYGDKCNFLHESPEKFKFDVINKPLPTESSAISVGTMGHGIDHTNYIVDQPDLSKNMSACSDALRSSIRPWKTRICSTWEITGQCPFGDTCNFAHGESELQMHVGHVEVDETNNSVTIPVDTLPVPVPPPSEPQIEVPTQETVHKQRMLKWKLEGKISHIYGDWLDEFIPPEELPS